MDPTSSTPPVQSANSEYSGEGIKKNLEQPHPSEKDSRIVEISKTVAEQRIDQSKSSLKEKTISPNFNNAAASKSSSTFIDFDALENRLNNDINENLRTIVESKYDTSKLSEEEIQNLAYTENVKITEDIITEAEQDLLDILKDLGLEDFYK